MKVLTAAPYIVGGVEVGFCGCQPGELVMLGATCECDCHRYGDEECGCRLDCEPGPFFSGLASLAESTTARVEERNLTSDDLRAAVRGGLERAGWLTPGLSDEVARVWVDSEVARIRRACASFPVGTLVGLEDGFAFPV